MSLQDDTFKDYAWIGALKGDAARFPLASSSGSVQAVISTKLDLWELVDNCLGILANVSEYDTSTVILATFISREKPVRHTINENGTNEFVFIYKKWPTLIGAVTYPQTASHPPHVTHKIEKMSQWVKERTKLNLRGYGPTASATSEET